MPAAGRLAGYWGIVRWSQEQIRSVFEPHFEIVETHLDVFTTRRARLCAGVDYRYAAASPGDEKRIGIRTGSSLWLALIQLGAYSGILRRPAFRHRFDEIG